MATIRIKMSPRGGAERRLYLRIQNGAERTEIATDIIVNADEWDPKHCVVTGTDTNSRITNVKIRDLHAAVELMMLRYELHTIRQSIDFSDLVRRVKKEVLRRESDSDRSPAFLEHFDTIMASRKPSTASVYDSTRKLIRKLFSRSADRLTFEDITPAWLRDLEFKMARRGNAPGYINIAMRNIRAVMNDAIDREYTKNYPFRRYRIGKVETIKRSLTVGDLRLLNDWKCEPYQEPYRDMFMLIFCLIGINLVDICHLKKITRDGRIEYRRAKTDKIYSIRVEPEAYILISRLSGKTHLLNVLDTYKDHHYYMRHLNRQLKRIGITGRGHRGQPVYDPMFPEITTYWARHTWATIAAYLDIPDETISHALGHAECNPTTAIYIKRYRPKIDGANRRVLDYVFGGIVNGEQESVPGTAEYYGLTQKSFDKLKDHINLPQAGTPPSSDATSPSR